MDTSSVHTDMHSIGNSTKTAENKTESVSKHQTEAQTQYSCVMPGINTANPTYQWKQVSIETETETAENGRGDIRTGQINLRKRNSPYTTEVRMPEPTYRWRKVSTGDGEVYVPWNMPIEASGQTFAFGCLESKEEVIVPGAEGKMAEGAGNSGGD